MSYKELNAFKKKVAGINETIAKLEGKKAKYEEKRNKAKAEHEGLLVAEAVLGKEADDKTLEKLRKEIAACDEEISEIGGRIVFIQSKRAESLKSYLPEIREGRDREIDLLKREADATFQEARKLMCEYLLKLQEVGRVRDKANKLHHDFVYHAKMVDPEEYNRNHWNRGDDSIVVPILFEDAAGIKLGIREADQKSALNGNVEPHVLLYSLTGELESDLNIARAKLREVAK